MARIAYFDCIAGISGDMVLGALLDVGLSRDALKEELMKLPIGDFDLEVRTVHKGPIAARAVTVNTADRGGDTHPRSPAEVLSLIEESTLAPAVKEKASRIFCRLADAEAQVHGVGIEDVHFHELGSVDTIVDIVGAVVGLELLGVEEVHASPLPLARGFVKCAHGELPLPAPATMELLRGVPVKGLDVDAELVTPTGAAIITTLAEAFGPLPPMHLESVGYGAGKADLPFPNVLRVIIGQRSTLKGEPEQEGWEVDRVMLLETNLDDLTPEICGYLMERLFAAGALDVFFTPIQMKKNRPGIKISALARHGDIPSLLEIIFTESTALGVRMVEMERRKLPRHIVAVATRYGTVRVKVSLGRRGAPVASPEYEDCRRIAEEKKVPLRTVYREALEVYRNLMDREITGTQKD